MPILLFSRSRREIHVKLVHFKKFFSDEPFQILNTMGHMTSAKTAMSYLEKIYGNENFIVKSILKAIRTIRIPHYRRQQWQKMEIKALY